MSYLQKDQNGLTEFSPSARKDYKACSVDYRDAHLMDMLGAMTFGCGKTRWDSPILFTHIDSRKIVVAVSCPPDVNGWDGCPYTTPNPGQTFAFVHEQGYEIRILGEKSDGVKGVIYKKQIHRLWDGEHWFKLPQFIREAWASSL
jgi:hypothetical protein